MCVRQREEEQRKVSKYAAVHVWRAASVQNVLQMRHDMVLEMPDAAHTTNRTETS